MSKKILSKLETFINNEEDFLNKKILVLNFKHKRYFWFKNKRKELFLKNLKTVVILMKIKILVNLYPEPIEINLIL